MREHQCQQLCSKSFDILIIGGGATGTGIALDAASRGLEVALVEGDDFAAGTSSRSTKLIHGGVRYLEKAIKQLDRSQYNLVRDALHERAVLLRIAPHLSRPLPLLTPLYHLWEVPYFLLGLKIYERLAGDKNIAPSRYVGKEEALEAFPMLKAEGLRGGVLYYDGQFDDARMNIAIAMTALREGATLANHVAVTALCKDDDGRLCGARVHDTLSGAQWDIHAKVVINATGPFADSIRHMDDPQAPPMLSASSGVHIVLDARFSPPDTGLLIPETDDGRVLFLLPWMGHTLVGTTDQPAQVTANPKASEAEISYLLAHAQRYFDIPLGREDVLATFSGLRPLVSDPAASDTASLSRDHVIHMAASGLLTIAGGKWTTYRKMAEDTVDQAIQAAGLEPSYACRTAQIPLWGGQHYHPEYSAMLQRKYSLTPHVADYLSHAYGDCAEQVLSYAQGQPTPLCEGLPYLDCEIAYATEQEMACNIVDILARRVRIGFVNQAATLAVLERVATLAAARLGWDDSQIHAHIEAARSYFSLAH